MNTLETGQKPEQDDNQELNRTLAAYFKFVGEKSGDESFREYKRESSVWIRVSTRNRVVRAAWICTNPKDSEYGMYVTPAEDVPENIFGYIDENGKQVILGERSYISFFVSTDGTRMRFDDNYRFFNMGIFEQKQSRRNWTNLSSSKFSAKFMNFPMPETSDRKSWPKKTFPQADQREWLTQNKPIRSPYKIIDEVLTELTNAYPLIFLPFSDFQKIYQAKKGGQS